jgi:hypothetical protein
MSNEPHEVCKDMLKVELKSEFIEILMEGIQESFKRTYKNN